jgi:hypothetical protein
MQVSILSVDMTKRKNKIKVMSSEFFQEKKKVYIAACNNASADSCYVTINY